MKNIYGSIGYTLLKKENIIIVFADKHDSIPTCKDNIDMANWFKTKFKTSIILLEEIPRKKESKILELWDQSQHTKMLKDLYLENPSIVKPVDIRHYLLPFSWEIINTESIYDITLTKYMLDIDRCLSMKNQYLLANCKLYDAKKLIYLQLGKHFLVIKDIFKKLIIKGDKLNILNNKIIKVRENNVEYLEEINNLISMIMEWYICACIYMYRNQPLIIHVGLAHSEQVIKALCDTYNYTLVEEQGINKLIEIDNPKLSGCVQISDNLNAQFGGFLKNLT